uniref:Endocuticle structural glycoprotein SgAbd-3 n=1 Tax=Zeugodacus cucurbitae TaxID=28588 RepID=A0A0A1XDW4_ZEUCU
MKAYFLWIPSLLFSLISTAQLSSINKCFVNKIVIRFISSFVSLLPFTHSYELGDGSKASQDGFLKKVDTEHEGESIEGKFAFVADDGKEYLVTYIADENGYQPQGEHLPTPPPVPESVLKTLKYLEEHPYNPEAAAKKH